jgi:glucose/arabinose dehydrogenase
MSLRFSDSQHLPISILIIAGGIAFCYAACFDYLFVYGSSFVESDQTQADGEPHLTDQNLKVEVVVEGLKRPTGMAFLSQDDFLVLEKNRGTVKRIVNGNILEPQLLDVEVANEKERGMLGIAIQSLDTLKKQYDNTTKEGTSGKILPTYVFLYFTESSGKDGIDDCPLINYCKEGTEPEGNRLYRYEFAQDKLVNPKLLLDLPATPGSDHVGGAMVIGPDSNVYLTTADGHSCSYSSCADGIEDTVLNSQSANVENGKAPDGRGGILRVTQDGLALREGKEGNLDENSILNKYFAYGIRNSFGIDFDPITGKLWDTENGPAFGDEINLVDPGFNSGWLKIQGMWPITSYAMLEPQGIEPPYKGYLEGDKNKLNRTLSTYQGDLVDFEGKGHYSEPEFTWNITVAITALKFLDSDKLGEKYENDMFAADYNYGRIYHFDLNENRTSLMLENSLSDKIAHSSEREELEAIILGEGFDAITDLEVGPDGYLYVVSHKDGKIFRIVPTG